MTPPSFAEAEQAFREYLKEKGWPTELIWVRAQDVRRGQPVLVFRSEETEGAAERDYEAARAQGQGLQLEALCTASGATCATVTTGSEGGLSMTAAEPRRRRGALAVLLEWRPFRGGGRAGRSGAPASGSRRG